MLQNYAFDNVRDAFAAVGRVLEDLVKFLPLDDRYRIFLVLEQIGDGTKINIVGFILEPMDLDKMLVHSIRLMQHTYGPANLNGLGENYAC